MNKDTATGMIGALVLVTAMAGVFLYERGQFEAYTVTWVPGDQNVTESIGASLSHQDDRDHRFHAAHPDALLSQVTVELHWEDPPEDTFRVEAALENGTVHREEASDGQLILKIPIQSKPADASFGDRSEDGAVMQAWRSLEDDQEEAGFGVWTVTVALVEAMRPNEVPVLEDEPGENGYHLVFQQDHWIPVVQKGD